VMTLGRAEKTLDDTTTNMGKILGEKKSKKTENRVHVNNVTKASPQQYLSKLSSQDYSSFYLSPCLSQALLGAFGFRRSSKTGFNSISRV
jgi:hypothetical protein